MLKKEIKEEKIIDGVKTEFCYEKSLFGERILKSKVENYPDKKCIMTYYTNGLEGVWDGTIKQYIEYKYIKNETGKEEFLHHGVEKYFDLGNLRSCGKDYPDKKVFFLKYLGNFNKDRIDKEYLEYYPNNNIFKQYYYENGFLHGDCNQFFPDGRKKIVSKYHYGKPIGLVKEFSSVGLKFEGEFEDGIPIGEHSHYDLFGKIEKIYSFIDGYKKFQKTSYYEDPNVIKSIESYVDMGRSYKRPRFVGPEYFNWGGPELDYDEYLYGDGVLDGNCKYFDKNNEIVEEGDYNNDEKVGVWFKNEDLKDIENDNE